MLGYTNDSRLLTVTENTVAGTPYSATYSYLGNSPLVSQIIFKQSTTTRMTTTKQYDYLNRLSSISSAIGSSAIADSYSYNAANQRTRSTLADGSYWLYEYDSLGQVRSGRKFWSDQTPVAGQQFEYANDDIGNRTQTKAGGDQSGTGLRPANYSANNLNQYTNRDVPGAVDIMGVSFTTNTVTVNSQATYRKGEYFRKEVPVSNGTGPVWQAITVSSNNQPIVAGHVFVQTNHERFYYDADGNLTNDGRWAYIWDAENRLVYMTNNTSVGPQQGLKFEYDWIGRRIHKQVWSQTSSPTNDVKFVYDGWNLLAELNGTNNAVIRSYVWGSDLSGSIQGAGGVGGLLKVAHNGTQTTNCFVAFDGNGNVAALADAATTNTLAQYEYGPFGEVIRMTGVMAKANPLRFSTEYQDDETELLYYGYRYYHSSIGRWLSCDPLGEDSSYMFARNNTLSSYDVLGLWDERVHKVRTAEWAGALGIMSSLAHNIGIFDDAVDQIYSTGKVPPFSDSKWSWHFNRSRSSDPNDDTRFRHRDEEVARAKRECTAPTDSAYNAAAHLGLALHPLQDWVAHGDFNRWQETPSLAGVDNVEARHYWHNWDAGGWSSKRLSEKGWTRRLSYGRGDGWRRFFVPARVR